MVEPLSSVPLELLKVVSTPPAASVVISGVKGLQIPHFGLFLGIIGSLAWSSVSNL